MTAAMPQIKKIVWLTLENRSLDSVLGWLYEKHDGLAKHVYPPKSSLRFDGITAADKNSVDWFDYAPAHGTQFLKQPLRQPRWNPDEWWENVGNQMYWDAWGNDSVPRWSAAKPPMTGFARDYSRFYDATGEVMGAYTSDQLPALYALAEAYAVSDRWFSSVPTETNPNRAFSVCGTSLGAVDNADMKYYDAPTIFNALTRAGKTWAIYHQYNGKFDMDPTPGGQCYTADVFPYIRKALDNQQGECHHYDKFLKALQTTSPELPDLCYIEPFWGGGYGLATGDDFIGLQGNDYHSPAWVSIAEYDLKVLYEAVRRSRYWKDMLFIITFDEHGGTYDHVPPTAALKPDDSTSARAFEFNWTGARVPTLLISPYVRPGTVFRAPTSATYDFDHTSFIATILLWAGLDPATAGLGLRVANAPTFDEVLDDTLYDNLPTLAVPHWYKDYGPPKGKHHIPFDIDGLDIQTFRTVLDASTSASEFLERLRAAVGE
jgi:phospholipase C